MFGFNSASRAPGLWLAAAVMALGLGPVRALALPPALPMDLIAHECFERAPQIHATEHFELICESDAHNPASLGEQLEAFYRSYFDAVRLAGFEVQEPDAPLTWICFSDRANFGAYARKIDRFEPAWLREYYSPRTNRVAIVVTEDLFRPASGDSADSTRISHEAAHQLSYSSGLLVAGVLYPVWISEGLATNLELSGAFGAASEAGPRRAQLLAARESGSLLPLEEFVAMTRFRPNEGYDLSDAYAQSNGLFRFLLTQRASGLRDYLVRLSKTEPGARDASQLSAEFTAAFGAFETIEPAWHQSLDDSTAKN